jgi:hypothetical protein
MDMVLIASCIVLIMPYAAEGAIVGLYMGAVIEHGE